MQALKAGWHRTVLSDILGVVLTSERLVLTPRMVEQALIQSPNKTPAPGRPWENSLLQYFTAMLRVSYRQQTLEVDKKNETVQSRA